MPIRARVLVTMMIGMGVAGIGFAVAMPVHGWFLFSLYLVMALLTSGMKVKRPSGSGSMSLNYTFIFLAITVLPALQVVLIAALSVAAQCRTKKLTLFVLVQWAFNVANSIVSTICAFATYEALGHVGLSSAPSLALAACVYFFCNTVPVASVIGWSQAAPVFALWKSDFFWFLPFYSVGAIVAAVIRQTTHVYGWATGVLVAPVVYTLYRTYNAQVEQWEERRAHLAETEALYMRTIEGLAMAIEAKDHNTHDHLFRVRDYVTDIATHMGLDGLEIKALQIAAFLHDIGKLAVPEHIINKPGKLSLEEFEKMKIHPSVGADILERVRFPYPVVPIVRSHHEQWDGGGYPDGLKGKDIPLGARILSVVDCFDALASDRPYRKAMPLDKALAIVKGSAGKQFDPEIVDVLEQRYLHLEATMEKQASFGALNVEVEIQRGEAPGAGFEQAAEESAAGEASGLTGASALALIAAATHEAQMLFEMSRMTGHSIGLNETAWRMESRLRALLPFDCCVVYLKNTEAVLPFYVTDTHQKTFLNQPIPLGEGLSGWVAQSGRSIMNGNATVEPIYQAGEAADPLRSALAVPLFDVDMEIFGVLTLYAQRAESFSRDHLRILKAAEPRFSFALKNALPAKVADLHVETDAITGLVHARGMFHTLDGELNRSRRQGSTAAFVLFSLDGFHQANEQHGHAACNHLLRALAKVLREHCRNYDTVARMGADEFGLLLPGGGESMPFGESGWVNTVVADACAQAGIEQVLTASVGTAIYPIDGDTAEELLAVASRRLHRNKPAHRAAAPVAVGKPVQHAPSTEAVAA